MIGQRTVFPALVLLCAVLIFLDKVDQALFESLRVSVADEAAPILEAASRPLDDVGYSVSRMQAFVGAYRENVRLAEENAKLLHWRQAALTLASENAQLRRLLKVAPAPGVSYVTARVIADTGGAYVRNLLVDAGSADNVTRGQAAVTGEGLIGRVTEVGARAARILLITDLNSRIPVIIERSRQRAILAGDNSNRPSLQYIDPVDPPKPSDRVVTSGEGGVFPPGLPVGTVAFLDDGKPRIEPYARPSQAAFVRIVDYGLGDGLPQPIALAPRRGPRAPTVTAAASQR
jgi:rod shape-determining protein MreC